MLNRKSFSHQYKMSTGCCFPFTGNSHRILLTLGLTFFFSCTQKDNFNFTYDVLNDCIAKLPKNTRHISFAKQDNPEHYLHYGWSQPETTHTWSNAKQAALLFYSYNTKQNQTLKITWQAIKSQTNSAQDTDIVLNGTSIGTLTAPQSLSSSTIVLPAHLINPGINKLEFRYTYTEKPKNRDLSVSFKELIFTDTTEMIKQPSDNWAQKPGSEFSFFMELPSAFELDIRFSNPQKSNARIDMTGENTNTVSVPLPRQDRALRKKIVLPRAGTYRISLSVTNEFTWKQFKIHMKKPGIDQAAALPSGRKKLPDKSDILIYVIDTLRSDHLGCYGYSRNTSPNIDRFAEDNTLYLNAYTPASWTRPSGASIVTGLLPRNHNTMSRKQKLTDEFITLAEMLQAQGYHTIYFSTNGNVGKTFGFDQGFDQFICLPESKSREVHVPSNKVNDRIFSFMDSYNNSKDRKPLFMLVWVTDPHSPYTPPDFAADLFGINQYTPISNGTNTFRNIKKGKISPTPSQIEFLKTRYDQEIFSTDHSFGRLLEKLKNTAVYKNMVIVLTADHGEEFFDHGGLQHGHTLYNELVRIPLVLKIPGLNKGTCRNKVQLIDIYPTILDLLEIEPPCQMDGISLLRNPGQNRKLYFEENLGHNILFARLDTEKKVIFNQKFTRLPSKKIIPTVEIFENTDTHEIFPLGIKNYNDRLVLQELIYTTGDNASSDNTGKSGNTVEIPPELDERLRALGYVQ